MKKIRLTSLGLLILASLFSLQAIASITGKAGDPPSDKGKEDEVPAEASRTETRPILLRKATKTQSASAPQLQDTTERTGGSGRGIEPERGIGRGVNPEPRVVGRGADLNHRPTVNGVGRGTAIQPIRTSSMGRLGNLRSGAFVITCEGNPALSSYLQSVWKDVTERAKIYPEDQMMIEPVFSKQGPSWKILYRSSPNKNLSSSNLGHDVLDYTALSVLNYFRKALLDPESVLKVNATPCQNAQKLIADLTPQIAALTNPTKLIAEVKKTIERRSRFGPVNEEIQLLKKLIILNRELTTDKKHNDFIKLHEKTSLDATRDRAQQCPTENINYNRPVRNQGKTQWCFAHAAADMLTHRMEQLHKDKKSKFQDDMVSALHLVQLDSQHLGTNIAWAFLNAKKGKKTVNPNAVQETGGQVDQLFTLALEHGVCFESELSLNDLKKTHDDDGDSFSDSDEGHAILGTALEKTGQFFKTNSRTEECIQNLLKDFPVHLHESLLEIFRNEDIKTQKKMLLTLKQGCKRYPFTEEEKAALALSTIENKGDPRNFIKALDVQLERQQMTSVSMNTNIFNNPSVKVASGTGTQHAVVIVGRQWDKFKGCMYQVRSSWGNKCKGIYWGCLPNGDILIPEAVLAESATKALYFKNPLK